MCNSIKQTSQSSINRTTVEDIIESLSNGDRVYAQGNKILIEDLNSESYMPTGYGVCDGTIPEDATEIHIDTDNDADIKWLKETYFSYGENYIPMTTESNYPTEIEEKLESVVELTKTGPVTISYDAFKDVIDEQVTKGEEEASVPDIRSNKQFSIFERMQYKLNKATTGIEINNVMNWAERSFTLSPRQLNQIKVLCARRKRDYSEGFAVRDYENLISKAYSQKWLIGVSNRIKKDRRITESGKNILRKTFNKRDYAICKKYRETTGRYIPMLMKRKAA